MQIVQEVLAQNHPEVWLDVRSKMEEKLQWGQNQRVQCLWIF
jgi:hypothetical protein